MGTVITVSNSQRSEFDFSVLEINSKYNILIHCVYDPVNHFDEEFAFLHDPALDNNTLVILWHAVEQGWWERAWIEKLDSIVATAPYKLVLLTGRSHKPNINKKYPHQFDIRFFPVFDIRSQHIFLNNKISGPQPVTTVKSKKFMCINAKDAAHRKYILGTLIKYNLLDQGTVSYQGRPGLQTEFESLHGFTADQLEHVKQVTESCNPVLPLHLDHSDWAGSLPRTVFLDTYLNIVGETHFVNLPRDSNASFVTEKTFNAIINNQMFIIVGHAGSLELLHHLGYRTFSDVIDESYDTVLDNSRRLEMVSAEIVRFLSRPIDEIQQDYVQVQAAIQHNRDLLYSQNLQTRLQQLVSQLD